MGFGLEVDMIRLAHEMDLLTTPYAFNAEQAKALAEAGADILDSAHGPDHQGHDRRDHGPVAGRLRAARFRPCTTRRRRVNRDILVLCHGGPIAEPADAQYILDHTEGIVGFYGASSMERLPVEPAIENRVREFTAASSTSPNVPTSRRLPAALSIHSGETKRRSSVRKLSATIGGTSSSARPHRRAARSRSR